MSDVSHAETNLRNARAGLAHLLSVGNAREAGVMLDLVKRFESEHKAAVEQVGEKEKQAIARAQGLLRCECEEIARFKGLRECVLHPKAQGQRKNPFEYRLNAAFHEHAQLRQAQCTIGGEFAGPAYRSGYSDASSNVAMLLREALGHDADSCANLGELLTQARNLSKWAKGEAQPK